MSTAQHTPGPWREIVPGVWKHTSGAEVQRLARKNNSGRYFVAVGVLDVRHNERKYSSLEAAQGAAIAKATGSAA